MRSQALFLPWVVFSASTTLAVFPVVKRQANLGSVNSTSVAGTSIPSFTSSAGNLSMTAFSSSASSLATTNSTALISSPTSLTTTGGSSTPLSTSAIATPSPISFIFNLEVIININLVRRQNLGVPQYVAPGGALTTSQSNASKYRITNGQLSIDGQLFSTSPGTAYAVFSPDANPGQITTYFGSDNGFLEFTNIAFSNRMASFCLTNTSIVDVVYNQSSAPICTPVRLEIVPVSGSANSSIGSAASMTTSTASMSPSVSMNATTTFNAMTSNLTSSFGSSTPTTGTVLANSTLSSSSNVSPSSSTSVPFVLLANPISGSPAIRRRQTPANYQYVDAEGFLQGDCQRATSFEVVNGQLFSTSGGQLSTSPGVANAPFVASTVIGSITTAFTVGGTLQWANIEFTAGTAAFCALTSGEVFSVFKAPPSGCSPVLLEATTCAVSSVSSTSTPGSVTNSGNVNSGNFNSGNTNSGNTEINSGNVNSGNSIQNVNTNYYNTDINAFLPASVIAQFGSGQINFYSGNNVTFFAQFCPACAIVQVFKANNTFAEAPCPVCPIEIQQCPGFKIISGANYTEPQKGSSQPATAGVCQYQAPVCLTCQTIATPPAPSMTTISIACPTCPAGSQAFTIPTGAAASIVSLASASGMSVAAKAATEAITNAQAAISSSAIFVSSAISVSSTVINVACPTCPAGSQAFTVPTGAAASIVSLASASGMSVAAEAATEAITNAQAAISSSAIFVPSTVINVACSTCSAESQAFTVPTGAAASIASLATVSGMSVAAEAATEAITNAQAAISPSAIFVPSTVINVACSTCPAGSQAFTVPTGAAASIASLATVSGMSVAAKAATEAITNAQAAISSSAIFVSSTVINVACSTCPAGSQAFTVPTGAAASIASLATVSGMSVAAKAATEAIINAQAAVFPSAIFVPSTVINVACSTCPAGSQAVTVAQVAATSVTSPSVAGNIASGTTGGGASSIAVNPAMFTGSAISLRMSVFSVVLLNAAIFVLMF